MGDYARKSCIALTWADDGRCWGVHLRHARRRLNVSLFWHSPAVDGQGVSSRLAEGFRVLQPRESTAVVAGGVGCHCGLVDLTMPKLGPDDLRSALSYELTKHAPISTDQLVWGYRLLPNGERTQQRVRLVCMREADWGRWTDDVSGLGQGVDMILPPPAALDPVLSDVGVYLLDDVTANGFLFAPSAAGGREALLSEPEDGGQVFGALPEPLSLPGLNLGGLADMPPEEQQAFAPAIVLAMYGMQRCVIQDMRTCLQVPYELRPRRNQASRAVAVLLALFLLGVAGFGLGREYYAAHGLLVDLRKQVLLAEAEAESLEMTDDPTEMVKEVMGDLQDAVIERPSMAECLVELTSRIDDDAWVPSFQWTDGKIDLQIRTDEEDPALYDKLKVSPVLLDIVPLRTTVDNRSGETTIAVQMRAAFNEAGRPLPPAQEGMKETEETEGTEEGTEEGTGEAMEGGGVEQELRPDAEPEPGDAEDPKDVEEPKGEAEEAEDADAMPPPPPPPPPIALPDAKTTPNR